MNDPVAEYSEKIELLELEIYNIKQKIHYPDCWDTMAYPTLLSAIHEMFNYCHTCGWDHQEDQEKIRRENENQAPKNANN